MPSPLVTTVTLPNHGRLPARNLSPPASQSIDTKNPGYLSFRNTVFALDDYANTRAYASALDCCNFPSSVKQIHAHAYKSGFSVHEYVGVKLLQAYGRFGCFSDAALLFEKMPVRNIYLWMEILKIYVDEGYLEEALGLFLELYLDGVDMEFFVFPIVLRICCGYGGFKLAKELHGTVIKTGFVSNIYVSNSLIDTYGKCGCLDDAKKVFNCMTDRDCVSWSSIVTACAENGMAHEALDILVRMSSERDVEPSVITWSAVIGGLSKNGYDEEALKMLSRMKFTGLKPNARTLASVLPSCSRLQRLNHGKEIHAFVARHDYMFNPFVVNGLLDLYRKCKDMISSWNVFAFLSTKDEIFFNSMITGYCENGDISKAKELFIQMKYEGKCMSIICWNSLISGFVSNSMFNESLCLFRELVIEEVKPDASTLSSVITACTKLRSITKGKELHSFSIVRGLQTNPFVGRALVEMYCKSKDLMSAQKAFDDVIETDTATWNALISGYATSNTVMDVKNLLHNSKEHGFETNEYTYNSILAALVENDQHEKALQLFFNMQSMDLTLDVFAVGIAITACSRLASLRRGMQVHAYVIRRCYESDSHIGSSLIDMYAKCGSIHHAELVYKCLKTFNLVIENAMLTAYAMHGYGNEGIALFNNLLNNGIKPDTITFLSALSSCVHAGSVRLGQTCLNMMKHYGLIPSLKHYTCVIDLLSRAGNFAEAIKVIRKMPMDPDLVTWGALLGGCVIHGNVEYGEVAAFKLMELDPYNSGNHVTLANLYASVGRWVDSNRARLVIHKEEMMHKVPGSSWIEDKDEIHMFVACDRSNSRSKEIYMVLDSLSNVMRDWSKIDDART